MILRHSEPEAKKPPAKPPSIDRDGGREKCFARRFPSVPQGMLRLRLTMTVGRKRRSVTLTGYSS
jgi:hypothetical protein